MIQAEVRRLARALASYQVLQKDPPRFSAPGQGARERAALPRPS